jgi:hypothetical protein
MRQTDDVPWCVRIRAADDRQSPAVDEQRVPLGHDGLVVEGSGSVPRLDRVDVVVPELPPRVLQWRERMCGDREAAELVHQVDEPRQLAAVGPVAPVDPAAGRQPGGGPA